MLAPYSSDSPLSISTRQPKIYRAKVTSMPVPDVDMAPMVLKAVCKPGKTATVTEICFNSHGRLLAKFDDIPFRNLGADRPR